MRKSEKTREELRPEYRREDFGKMTRGKYAKQVKAASNVKPRAALTYSGFQPLRKD